MLAVFFVSTASTIAALDPTSHISQYGHSVWRLQDGYFGATPRQVAQTTDGYIWIGTSNGLFKFDGVRFIRWSAPSGDELPSLFILGLLGARDGSLWIATDAGLAHLVNGRLALYEQGWRISYLVEDEDEDEDEKIWFTRYRNADHSDPLCHIFERAVHCYGSKDGLDVFNSQQIEVLVQDSSGDLWIGGERTLLRWHAGASKVYRPQGLQSNPGFAGVVAITPVPDGSLWVGIAVPGRGGSG